MVKFKVFNGYQDNKSVYGPNVWIDDLANEWIEQNPYIQILDMQYQCCIENNVTHERLCIMYADEYI